MRRVLFERDDEAATHYLMDWQVYLHNAELARKGGVADVADMLENNARRAREKASDITLSRYALPQYALHGVEAIAKDAALKRQKLGGFLMCRAYDFAKNCGYSEERALEIVVGPELYALHRERTRRQ